MPIDCWLAVEKDQLIGFGCVNATAKAFFGPTGVSEAARGRGIGRALLIACLHGLRWEGYAYAIIGGVGPIDFYNKAVGATVIENSTPSVYGGMIGSDDIPITSRYTVSPHPKSSFFKKDPLIAGTRRAVLGWSLL